MHEGAENEGNMQWRGAGRRESAQRFDHVLTFFVFGERI
jgi:hypothetical protein